MTRNTAVLRVTGIVRHAARPPSLRRHGRAGCRADCVDPAEDPSYRPPWGRTNRKGRECRTSVLGFWLRDFPGILPRPPREKKHALQPRRPAFLRSSQPADSAGRLPPAAACWPWRSAPACGWQAPAWRRTARSSIPARWRSPVFPAPASPASTRACRPASIRSRKPSSTRRAQPCAFSTFRRSAGRRRARSSIRRSPSRCWPARSARSSASPMTTACATASPRAFPTSTPRRPRCTASASSRPTPTMTAGPNASAAALPAPASWTASSASRMAAGPAPSGASTASPAPSRCLPTSRPTAVPASATSPSTRRTGSSSPPISTPA